MIKVKRAVIIDPAIIRKAFQDNHISNVNIPETKFNKYAFYAHKTIFHPNDPIRVFINDPEVENSNNWYHFFCGFVSDISQTLDVNNTNKITIVSESPEKLIRYSRYTSNPGIADINSQSVAAHISQYAGDLSLRSAYANAMQSMTLMQALRAIFFGFDTGKDKPLTTKDAIVAGVNAAAATTITENEYYYEMPSTVNPTLSKKISTGIGFINYSKSKTYVLGTNKESDKVGLPITLPKYQESLSQRVSIHDLKSYNGNIPNDIRALYGKDTSDKNIANLIGSRPDLYPPGNGGLILLMPPTFVSLEVGMKDIIKNFAMTTEWSTRGELLYSLIERIEFVFYTTPRGDYVIEMPLYDFKPVDFKSGSIDYAQYYTIGQDKTVGVSILESDEKVHTQVTCTHTIKANYDTLPI
jgi:hypothetical protein